MSPEKDRTAEIMVEVLASAGGGMVEAKFRERIEPTNLSWRDSRKDKDKVCIISAFHLPTFSSSATQLLTVPSISPYHLPTENQ